MISKRTREFVLARSGGLCEKCKSPGDWRGLQIHHIKPLKMGGRHGEARQEWDQPDNLIVLCAECHRKEHDAGHKD